MTRLVDLLQRGIAVVAVLLLLGLALLPVVQILVREVLRAPIFGLDEAARMLMILLVWITYPLVVARGENIVMAELKAQLPRGPQRVADRAIGLACAAASVVMVWATAEALAANPRNMTPTLGIPFWIYLAAAAFGFGGAALLHLSRLRRGQDDGSVAL